MFSSLYRYLSNITLLPNFSWLAKISTGRTTILNGLLPPLATILSLAAVSAAIALGAWFWMGFLAAGVSMLPIYITAAAAVSGFTLLNFWFSRAINFAMLSAREVREGFGLDEHNPTDLLRLVDHVLAEVNAHLRKDNPNHKDIPRPRICTFADIHFKVITVEGRNPGKAALFFSSGCFNSPVTHMNQRHLAALISFELYKIARHRGVTRTFVQMWTDMLSTLENARSGNFLSKALGFFAGPLQFFLLLQRSVSRSYEYEAGKAVVDMGRGMDLVDAIDYKVCGPLFKKGTYVELQKDRAKRKRPEPLNYKGPFAKYINAFADWIDNNEYAGDDKTGWRLLSFLDICVEEFLVFINEIFSDKPRSTRLKDYLRPLLKLDVDNTPEQVRQLYLNDINTNQNLYEKITEPKPVGSNIPPLEPYAPIAPQGDGYVDPIRLDHPLYRHAKYQAKEKQIQDLEERLNVKQTEQLEALKAEISQLKAQLQAQNPSQSSQLEAIVGELRAQLQAQDTRLQEHQKTLDEQKQQTEQSRELLASFQLHQHNGHDTNGNGHGKTPPGSPTKKRPSL